jgi:hypothetical protein
MKTIPINACLWLALVWPSGVRGQSYEIESHVISGGGGTSSGGDYAINGTIGQPAAGFSGGGGSRLAAGFWNAGPEVVVEPDESFQKWMDNLPPGDQPPAGERGPDDEPTGDGMSNLLKYALGLMPMTPSADSAPKLVIEQDKLVLELGRSPDAAVRFHLEASPDLETWSDIGFDENTTDSDIGDSRERVRLLTTIETTRQDTHFLRLRVRMD